MYVYCIYCIIYILGMYMYIIVLLKFIFFWDFLFFKYGILREERKIDMRG